MKLAVLSALAAIPLVGCIDSTGDEQRAMPWTDGFADRLGLEASISSNVPRPVIESSADAVRVEKVPIFDINAGEPIRGASAMLGRGSATHGVGESTSQLPPDHVIAMFYVVFNNPENCTAPFPPLSLCSEADLGDPATGASILWADGIAGGNGHARFQAAIGVGTSGAPGEVLFGEGLQNVAGAEVHLLTRDKGPAIPGSVEDQRTTFFGGCDVVDCSEVQFAIFKAPGG